MIFEQKKKKFANSPRVNKYYIELIASYVHPKNSNHLRSHLRAIMALDHCRIIRPGKNWGRIFCVRQVYFTKSRQQIWVRVKQPFIPFIHHIRGETVLWGIVFVIQTSDRMQYSEYVFHNFAIQVALIQYSERSKQALAFS